MKWNSRLADNTETWKLIQYYFALHPLFIKSRLKMERFEFKIKISLKLKLCVHFKRLFYPVNFFLAQLKIATAKSASEFVKTENYATEIRVYDWFVLRHQFHVMPDYF